MLKTEWLIGARYSRSCQCQFQVIIKLSMNYIPNILSAMYSNYETFVGKILHFTAANKPAIAKPDW